jgi:hypothetical protein
LLTHNEQGIHVEFSQNRRTISAIFIEFGCDLNDISLHDGVNGIAVVAREFDGFFFASRWQNTRKGECNEDKNQSFHAAKVLKKATFVNFSRCGFVVFCHSEKTLSPRYGKMSNDKMPPE